MSKIIGIDFGGVVVDHVRVKCQVARDLFGVDISYGPEATREKMIALLGKASHDQVLEMATLMHLEAPVMAGTCEALDELENLGYSFVCISMQTRLKRVDLEDYLWMHNISIPQTVVVPNDEEKRNVCAKMGLVAYIDDNRSVLKHLEGLNTELVWFDALGAGEPSPYHRVGSWPEVVQLIRRLKL